MLRKRGISDSKLVGLDLLNPTVEKFPLDKRNDAVDSWFREDFSTLIPREQGMKRSGKVMEAGHRTSGKAKGIAGSGFEEGRHLC